MLNLKKQKLNLDLQALCSCSDRLATVGMGRKWGGAAVGARPSLGPQLPI